MGQGRGPATFPPQACENSRTCCVSKPSRLPNGLPCYADAPDRHAESNRAAAGRLPGAAAPARKCGASGQHHPAHPAGSLHSRALDERPGKGDSTTAFHELHKLGLFDSFQHRIIMFESPWALDQRTWKSNFAAALHEAATELVCLAVFSTETFCLKTLGHWKNGLKNVTSQLQLYAA